MRILLVISFLQIMVACGKDEKTRPEYTDSEIDDRFDKLKVLAPGDQVGNLSETRESILADDYWVDKEQIDAGTEFVLCSGKSPARVRYTFNWKRAAGGNYYWTGEALKVGGTFLSSCQAEGDEELRCEYIDCDKI